MEFSEYDDEDGGIWMRVVCFRCSQELDLLCVGFCSVCSLFSLVASNCVLVLVVVLARVAECGFGDGCLGIGMVCVFRFDAGMEASLR